MSEPLGSNQGPGVRATSEQEQLGLGAAARSRPARRTFPCRHRVIQPMGVSPRGQLTSLQDAVCASMEGQLSSDPDSDPD